MRYSSLALVHAALPHQSRLKRYLPLALFLLALASLVVALARPVTIVSVPTNQTSIILAIDVSRSMCSTDILPSRIEAAQAAALSFVQRQKANTQIGVVAFSGFAELVQPPTTDPELLQGAIGGLMTGRRTAIGSGILQALDAIAEIDKTVAPTVKDSFDRGSTSAGSTGGVRTGYHYPAIGWGKQRRPISIGRSPAGCRPGCARLYDWLWHGQRLRIPELPTAVYGKRAVRRRTAIWGRLVVRRRFWFRRRGWRIWRRRIPQRDR